MAQMEIIMQHVDAQQARLYDPLRRDVDGLKTDIRGNGKTGLLTKVAVMQNEQETIKDNVDEFKTTMKDMDAKISRKFDEIETKIDKLQWKLAGILGGATILTQVVLQYLFKQ